MSIVRSLFVLPAPSVRRVLATSCLVGSFWSSGAASAADPAASAATLAVRANTTRVQALVDEFRSRLSLATGVTVSIVPENRLLASVQPPADPGAAFTVSFEASFLDALTDDDLRAVVAHELGHVWIFTHHPYLQTEALANRIAERLVTRESLERVYARVAAKGVASGTVARFADAR